MIRIPDGGRIEFRLADGAANPYLLPAATARRRPRRHPQPRRDPGKRLDINMYTEGAHGQGRQAAAAQPPRRAPRPRRESGLPRRLGDEFVSAYLKLKHAEWNDYARHLTDWERQTTLDC